MMKKPILLFTMLVFSTNIIKAQTVTIGKQVWMAKNLNVSTFRNGAVIAHAKTDAEWMRALEKKQPAWCYYDNDPTNGVKYGKLYNWYAVNDPRGLEPPGFHVPTQKEWDQLTGFLGEEAGLKMKSKVGWEDDGNGTNSSGFSGLPGGRRYTDGTFEDVDSYGYWWTSVGDLIDLAWFRSLSYKRVDVLWRNDDKASGFSVRCIRD